MEEEVFVSDTEIITVKDLSKFVFKLFDKEYKTSVFSTSLISTYNAKKYEQQALELLGLNSWSEAIYGLKLLQFSVLRDSDNPSIIVGLSCKKGLFLKNEIKPFNKVDMQNLDL